MKKSTGYIVAGVVSVASLLGAAWYSVTYNDSRLVVPTDFSTFQFQSQDFVMLTGISLFVIYVFIMIGVLICGIIKSKKQDKRKTRTLNPKLGLLGFFGFLGFGGFWTYALEGRFNFFLFFLFFGFFGFYYEGKMSGTFKDERFLENSKLAQFQAMKVGFSFIVLLMFVIGSGLFQRNLEFLTILIISSLALICALTLFLSEYYLYKLDHDEMKDETE